MKYKISNSSLNNLKTVDARLIILVSTYLSLGKKDIGVTYGARSQEEHEQNLKNGVSKAKRSKHQPIKENFKTAKGFGMSTMETNAIDILAYDNGKARWDREFYKDIIEDMREIAAHFGWQDVINFGWDFKTLNDPYHISVKENGDNGIK